ncbi:MAG: hypothetical protein ACLP9L_22135 [Thermoguttaceae bacterium]
MAKFGRPYSGPRNMKGRPSPRLRLEYLETRSLLSAIGLPLAPLVVPPSPPAVLSEFYPVDGHHIAQLAMQEAVQNAAAMPGGNPILAPGRLFQGLSDPSYETLAVGGQLSDLSNAALTPRAHPTFAPDQLSLGFSDLTPAHDLRETGDPTNITPLLPDPAIDARNGLADSCSVVPVQNLSVSILVVNLDPAQDDGATIINTINAGIDTINAGSPAHSLEVAEPGWPPSHDITGERSESTSLTIHAPPQQRFSGDLPPDVAPDVPPNAAPAFDPAVFMHGMIGSQPNIDETLLASRGPAGFRGPLSRDSDDAIESSAGNDVSLSVESFVPPVKGHSPNMPGTNDVSPIGDQAFAAMETSLSASNGAASPPATNAAFLDTATSNNSMEGGLIALDDTSATVPMLGNAPPHNTGVQAGEGTGLDQGYWLTDILSSPRKPTGAGSSRDVLSGGTPSVEVSPRSALVILRPVAVAEEGGGIELAMEASSPAAAGDDSLLAGESSAGNAAQQLSDIRPESGVGLFCDIEVSAAPKLPMRGSASAAIPYQDALSLVADTGFRGWKANPATEFVPPPTKRAQLTMAGLTDQLPLLLGATILVSRGGLRLEEKVSERDRRFRCIADLR